MEASRNLPEALQQAIENALVERFGTLVHIVAAQNFRPSWVFRCTLASSANAVKSVPNTVIVRIAREGVARTESSLLDTERTALQYLNNSGSPLAPRFLASGAGFLVSEDLGSAPSLLDLLLGENREAATQGALAFARSLGTLHAQTAAAGEIGCRPTLPHAPPPIMAHWQQVQEAVTLLGLPLASSRVDQDLAEIVRTLDEPGEYLALSSGDPSVVNCKITDGDARFFDFEAACLRHALVDATVLRFFYPTGGPAWRLPKTVARQIESEYRTVLAKTCLTAAEDDLYERGMVLASAAWMIMRMARLFRVDAGPDRDAWELLPPGWSGPIPTRSRRRQLVSILETFAASADQMHYAAALTDWCAAMIDALRKRWPEAGEELPLYPAFLP